jgi:hypothetical protein
MSQLRLSGGVYRTTIPNRLVQLDRFIQTILESHFSRDEPLEVQDWAASSCITSAEWFPFLQSGFPLVSLTASDLHLELVEVRFPNSEIYILEESGEPLQYVKAPFVLPLDQTEPAALPVNRWLQARVRKKFEVLRAKGYFDPETFPIDRQEWRNPPAEYQRISMVHPNALALCESNSQFRIQRHSVFEASYQKCQIVRSMNIFNKFYFDTEQLLQGVRSVWASLQEGGLWLVGRSTDVPSSGQDSQAHVHDASVLQKTCEGFRLVARHSTPSEIEDIALALQA